MKHQLLKISPFFFLLLLLQFNIQAQKIPFQGKLTQDDDPFNGSVTMEFSIPDVEWTETHEGVGVLDGFYSVVLGEINPLPDSLFAGVDECALNISVDGTALSQVRLYKPLETLNPVYRSVSLGRPGDFYTSVTPHLLSLAGPDSSFNILAMYNWQNGGGDMPNRGALWLGTSMRENNETGVNDRRVDLLVADDGFGGGVGRLNLKGPHHGEEGARKFAELGAFSNDGENHFGSLMLRGTNSTDQLATLRVERNEEGQEEGVLTLRGDDGREFRLTADGVVGSGSGQLVLNTASGNEIFNVADNNGAGQMLLFGPSTLNFQMMGKYWEDTNLPYFLMFGSQENEDGGYLQNIELEISNDGTYDAGSFRLNNTEQGASYNTVEILGNGNNNSGHLTLRNSQAGDRIVLFDDELNGGTLQLIASNGSSSMSAVDIVLSGENGQTVFMSAHTGVIEASEFVGSLSEPSDERLKENIKTQENALEKVKQLRGVTYEWKKDETDAQNIGFIAQEIEKVYPEVVHTKSDGYKSVNYAALVSALVEAIKELDAENKALKASLESSQSESIAKLQAEIDEIKKLLGASVSPAMSTGASK